MPEQHQEKSREADEPIKVNIALNGKIGPLVIAKRKGMVRGRIYIIECGNRME